MSKRRPLNDAPVVSIALSFDRKLNQLDEKKRKEVLDILWFYHVGRHYDWNIWIRRRS